MARLPERAAWTVAIDPAFLTNTNPTLSPAPVASKVPAKTSPEDKEKKDAVVLKSINVEKAWPIYHESLNYSDGSKKERWIVQGFQVMEDSQNGGALVRVSPSTLSSDYSNYSATDFPEFSWVGPQNFVGEGLVDKAQARIYAAKVHNLTELRPGMREILKRLGAGGIGGASDKKSSTRTPEFTVKAYISKLDGRPLALEVGGAFKKWETGTPPAGNLALPPAFAAEFKAWTERITRYKKAPSP